MSLDDTSLDNISDINEQWNNVQYAIKLAAKDNILQRTSVIKNDPYTVKNSSIYRNMRFLHNLLFKIKRATKSQDLLHIANNTTSAWIYVKAKLFAIAQEFDTGPRLLLIEVTVKNFTFI